MEETGGTYSMVAAQGPVSISQGPTGATGTTGATGNTGTIGSQGTASSVQGAKGAQGASPQGTAGAQGSSGAQGSAGASPQGATGTTGTQGTSGTGGTTGAQGSTGATGAQGTASSTQGITGSQGASPQGTAGANGSQGIASSTQGAKGAQGRTGVQGKKSDIRLKKQIRSYSAGVQKVLSLSPHTFRYNGLFGTPTDGRDVIGLVANELQAVIPEAVFSVRGKLRSTDPECDVLHYDLVPVVMTNVNAIKELVATFDNLKSRTQRLEEI